MKKIEFDDGYAAAKEDIFNVRFISGMAYRQLYQMYVKQGNIKIVTAGSLRQIHFPDGSIKKFFISGVSSAGTHICFHVLKNVRERVEKGEYVIKHTSLELFQSDYNATSIFQFWHKDGIRNAVLSHKGLLKSIDINYCYWNTIHNIGAINDHVYKMGLKKEAEWKNSRNMAIGSLSKRYVVQVVDEKGKIKTTIHKSPLEGVRLDVLAHIYKMAVAIAKKLDTKFCFFFTDCFFVTPDAEEETIKMLEECGFKSKVKNDRILSFKKRTKTTFELNWERTEKINKGFDPKECVSINMFNLRGDLENQPDYILENGIGILKDEKKRKDGFESIPEKEL